MKRPFTSVTLPAMRALRADIAIVGAGPYGLSLAAHLSKLHPRVLIFGRPMDSWINHMPEGMWLKSDGFASNLADPADAFTLQAFCRREGLPYAHRGEAPIPLETFSNYGLAFQRRFAPGLDATDVTSITHENDGFRLKLSDGRIVPASRVVLAVGIGPYASTPDVLAALPAGRVSHSFDHSDLSAFSGRRVAVIGGGSSAIDMATLLAEAGAKATLVARRNQLNFSAVNDGTRPSLAWRLKNPASGLGPGWRSRLATDLPLLIHAAPRALRHRFVRQHLGPGASGWMRQRFEAAVPALLGRNLPAAVALPNGELALTLEDREERREILTADHVIAATGFRVDLRRLRMLAPDLLARIALEDGWPALTTHFETSVPGLFVIGPAAAGSFGPLLRFAFGARFAARRLAPKLASLSRWDFPSPQSLTLTNGLTP